MSVQTKTTLKSYFNTGDKPTEAQFADLIDSCYNDLLQTQPVASVNVTNNTSATLAISNVSYDVLRYFITYWYAVITNTNDDKHTGMASINHSIIHSEMIGYEDAWLFATNSGKITLVYNKQTAQNSFKFYVQPSIKSATFAFKYAVRNVTVS